ncbi:hypothetical protein ACWGCI_16220 [Streptomyces sp. NPDC054949]|uniref:hypothetical protein n=1 Tax=Streptomyces sp. NBC_00424 TaxID=2903648 RepID=UPI00225AC298|nr:hypothetical protein [Streptomyces sp. NBC_00424]MCX5077937.1 hypothetical protein [Streptomyces sp. NBC_00424]
MNNTKRVLAALALAGAALTFSGTAHADGVVTAGTVQDFVRSSAIPLIDDIGPDNHMGYLGEGITTPLDYLFVEDAN